MRLLSSVALIGLALLVPLSSEVSAGSHFSGVNSTSMDAVKRDRQERARKCSEFAGFDASTMTYAGAGGKRLACP